MKAVRILLVSLLAVSLAAPAILAQPRQLLQGTQIHLQLLTDISTGAARDGDPFMAIVTEPVAIGDQLILPAGTRVNGIITTINKARRFSIFRGEAYLNLAFRSVEVDSRLIPVQMSLLAIAKPAKEGEGRKRKDVKITGKDLDKAKLLEALRKAGNTFNRNRLTPLVKALFARWLSWTRS